MLLNPVFPLLAVTTFVPRHANQNRRHPSHPQRGQVIFRCCLAAFAAALFILSTQTALAVTVGNATPDCALSSLDGGQTSGLNQYRGKVVYVDFWASWCGPCAKSFPFLNDLHTQLGAQGLQIVGVNLDEKADDAKDFLAKYPASFTIAADASKQCAKDFGVKAMPSSYLIDRKGIVHHIHLGFRPGEAKELRELVEELLGDKVAGLK